VIAHVKIAFYIHKDDCPKVLLLFYSYYQTILLHYPAVPDHHFIFVLYINFVNASVILMIESVKSDSLCYNSFLYP